MSKMLDNLNEQQRQAVECINGPVMVFAGAGTGKTRTLIHRIAYMIEKGVDPSNILAITFTKKATNEMRERLDLSIGSLSLRVHISTIHSLCNWILRRHITRLGYQADFEIIDDEEIHKILTDIYKEKGLVKKMYPPKTMAKLIGDFKNHMRTINTTDEESIFESYQNHLVNNNLVDFDDLLLLANRLFDENPDLLEYYQERFKYILVDEFQDTNIIQYDLVKKLSNKYQNIFVVGDDDQSIYSFRGACVDNMFSFIDDFQDVKVFKLIENYRSTQMILNGSNALIKNNELREEKELFSQIPGKINDVIVHDAYYYEDEVRFVVNEIIHLINQKDYHYSEIAVLYRNNALSRNFELGFIENRVPYNIYGGFSYLKRKEIKDICSYLRFIVNPSKYLHFQRIIDRPSRGIGEKTLSKLFEYMDETGLNILDAIEDLYQQAPSTKMQSLKDFKDIIVELNKTIEQVTLQDFFDLVVDKTGYLEMLKLEDFEENNRVSNLMEFKSILFRIEEVYKDSELTQQQKLQNGLDEIILDQSFGDEKQTDGVVLSTIHSVKGLEFKAVFVVGLEEGIFPAIRDDVEIEEERRVAYVAFTRAKEKLYLTSASRRLIYGRIVRNPKSRFLTEYLVSDDLKKAIELQNEAKTNQSEVTIGSKVNHTFFGYGVVVAIDGKFAQILFENDNSIRKIAKDHPTITKI